MSLTALTTVRRSEAEGGIYEEGTPKQIFEHPEKELTRKFISRNFALEVGINSDNILALKILESVTEKIEYTDLAAGGKSADGPFTNLIHMKIR